MAANIRVFCETTKFLEEFLILALISHRFGFTSHWSVGPVDKSPFGRRFSIHGFAQILSLQQRFSLSFAAIDISLHANYALILLNTNCTNYTNKVYHQYSVPTIFQVVTPISFFEKCYICSPPQYRSALVVARMGEFILSNVPQISLNTQIFKIYQTIPNLFFSLLVRVSVVLSTSKMPWRSWEVKVPKYSPSINFFNGIEKSMPQSTKLSYFKNSG